MTGWDRVRPDGSRDGRAPGATGRIRRDGGGIRERWLSRGARGPGGGPSRYSQVMVSPAFTDTLEGSKTRPPLSAPILIVTALAWKATAREAAATPANLAASAACEGESGAQALVSSASVSPVAVAGSPGPPVPRIGREKCLDAPGRMRATPGPAARAAARCTKMGLGSLWAPRISARVGPRAQIDGRVPITGDHPRRGPQPRGGGAGRRKARDREVNMRGYRASIQRGRGGRTLEATTATLAGAAAS